MIFSLYSILIMHVIPVQLINNQFRNYISIYIKCKYIYIYIYINLYIYWIHDSLFYHIRAAYFHFEVSKSKKNGRDGEGPREVISSEGNFVDELAHQRSTGQNLCKVRTLFFFAYPKGCKAKDFYITIYI